MINTNVKTRVGKFALGLFLASLTFALGVSLSWGPRALKAQRFRTQLKREAALRRTLWELRSAIDQCQPVNLELRLLPRSVQGLVDVGCLSEIPLDPITEKREWQEVVVDMRGFFDIVTLTDVRSTSRAVSSEGTTYNEW